jgi:uncharacterized membrane protein
MIAVLIWLLAFVVVVAFMTILVLADIAYERVESDKARLEIEVRHAERRLHDLARTSFENMLREARKRDGVV